LTHIVLFAGDGFKWGCQVLFAAQTKLVLKKSEISQIQVLLRKAKLVAKEFGDFQDFPGSNQGLNETKKPGRK